jgi:hypothetical protein
MFLNLLLMVILFSLVIKVIQKTNIRILFTRYSGVSQLSEGLEYSFLRLSEDFKTVEGLI